MGQLVVMTRADLDALLQDAIAASRSLVPEPVKEELLPTMADEYVTRQQAARFFTLMFLLYGDWRNPTVCYHAVFPIGACFTAKP